MVRMAGCQKRHWNHQSHRVSPEMKIATQRRPKSPGIRNIACTTPRIASSHRATINALTDLDEDGVATGHAPLRAGGRLETKEVLPSMRKPGIEFCDCQVCNDVRASAGRQRNRTNGSVRLPTLSTAVALAAAPFSSQTNVLAAWKSADAQPEWLPRPCR